MVIQDRPPLVEDQAATQAMNQAATQAMNQAATQAMNQAATQAMNQAATQAMTTASPLVEQATHVGVAATMEAETSCQTSRGCSEVCKMQTAQATGGTGGLLHSARREASSLARLRPEEAQEGAQEGGQEGAQEVSATVLRPSPHQGAIKAMSTPTPPRLSKMVFHRPGITEMTPANGTAISRARRG
jgi:hypothetical protein